MLDLESLQLAREMGYTGAALKACKGQGASLLLGAAAQKMGLFLCVQDLTCPGASLLHSAGLAAHVPGVAAVESNGRQYCPAANAPATCHSRARGMRIASQKNTGNSTDVNRPAEMNRCATAGGTTALR